MDYQPDGDTGETACQEETTADMAEQASRLALEQAGIAPEDLDLIVVGDYGGSCDSFRRPVSCRRVWGQKAMALTLTQRVPDFVFHWKLRMRFLEQGVFKNALVLGGGNSIKIMDWTDRSTCVLFGDGAGAAVLAWEETGILSFDQGCDGVRGSALVCRGRGNNNPLVTTGNEPDYVHMDGREVYKFAVTTVPVSIHKALEQAGLQAEGYQIFFLHQANLRIIQSVAKKTSYFCG